MQKCTNCNTENSMDLTSCKVCNAPLNRDENYNCPGCQSEIGPLAQECPRCGLSFSRNFKMGKKSSNHQPRRVTGGQIEFRQPKITYMEELEEATKQRILEHYNELSKTLNVMPKLIVHPVGKKLKHLFHAYYHQQNVIEVVHDEEMIATLAHEMRHVYQAKYKQKMYFQTHITNAKEFAESDVEKDARKFALTYCEEKGLKVEVAQLKMQEMRIQAFLNGHCSAKEAGIDEGFLRLNPTIPKKKVEIKKKQAKMQTKQQATATRKMDTKTKIILGILLLLFALGFITSLTGLFTN